MSRSFRRFAVLKDRAKTSKRRFKPKTCAARAVRRSEIGGGKGAYRRYYCSWEISDYRITGEPDEKELRRRWENGDRHLRYRYDSHEQAYRDWKKTYKRK